MLTKEILKEQEKLDKLKFWLSKTTEEFDDWDYDGEELIIFLRDEAIEKYKESDLKEFIEGF